MLRNLTKIMHNKYGKILISVILGLGVASLFRRSCKDRKCMVFRAPSMNEVEQNIYKHDGGCYKFSHNAITCDPNRETIYFEDPSNI